jgi:hypothetical protein
MRTANLLAVLLASNVSARIIPAWFLNHPPTAVTVRNLDDSTIIRSSDESTIIRSIEESVLEAR